MAVELQREGSSPHPIRSGRRNLKAQGRQGAAQVAERQDPETSGVQLAQRKQQPGSRPGAFSSQPPSLALGGGARGAGGGQSLRGLWGGRWLEPGD